MNKQRYSIVIPARNGERFLSFALASAVQQTRRPDEIIVVDDASTDATADLVQSPNWKERVRYYYHEKGDGFVDARNQALKKASGDFIILLHQDDVLHPEYLSVIEKASERYPNAKHFYTACNYIDEGGRLIGMPPGPYSFEPVLYPGKQYAHNYLNGVIQNKHIHRCPGVTTSRKLLLNKCTYRKEAGHIADDDFFLRVGAFTDVVGISQPLASFRHHSGLTTNTLVSLSSALAEAYLFQVRYYQKNLPVFLDSNDVDEINKLAVKFINLLLFQGLSTRQLVHIQNAFLLRQELNKLIPFFMTEHLPRWAKIMWALASGHSVATGIYVRFIQRGIATRDWVRRKLFKDKAFEE